VIQLRHNVDRFLILREDSSGKSSFIQTFLAIGKILLSGDDATSEASIFIWKTFRDQTFSSKYSILIS